MKEFVALFFAKYLGRETWKITATSPLVPIIRKFSGAGDLTLSK
jgi:hypothetical protein